MSDERIPPFASTVEPLTRPTPGTVMGGFRTVLTPLQALERRLVALVVEQRGHAFGQYGVGQSGIPLKKPTRFEQGKLQGEIEALALAIVAIRTGSDWYTGDQPGRLVSNISAEVYQAEQANDAYNSTIRENA